MVNGRKRATMSDAATKFYDSLESYADVDALVARAEAEGLYLECKAPHEPRVNKGVSAKLAEALSGFSNTSGGVILWGVSTTTHEHSKLDVLTQMEPIGKVRQFAQDLDRTIPRLTTPAVLGFSTKVLLEKPSSTRGVAVTLVQQTKGDPVQSTVDSHFHFPKR